MGRVLSLLVLEVLNSVNLKKIKFFINNEEQDEKTFEEKTGLRYDKEEMVGKVICHKGELRIDLVFNDSKKNAEYEISFSLNVVSDLGAKIFVSILTVVYAIVMVVMALQLSDTNKKLIGEPYISISYAYAVSFLPFLISFAINTAWDSAKNEKIGCKQVRIMILMIIFLIILLYFLSTSSFQEAIKANVTIFLVATVIISVLIVIVNNILIHRK
ncbi:biotin transporter BioY [Neisseria sp. HSC-16F19]|nr:hypothetical protein [Neisseria sp. HSC-16F19]MCP2039563.1 biotin transporter BioY [Neisseria sp. HSC-16F19]